MNLAVRRLMPILASSRIVARGIGPFQKSVLSSTVRCHTTEPTRNANDEAATKSIIDSVNNIIESNNVQQTFAVIHLYGQQYLVHLGDILCVQKSVPVEIGETIKLEKC